MSLPPNGSSNRRSERAPLLGGSGGVGASRSDADLAAAAQRVRLANEVRDEEYAYDERRKRRGIVAGVVTFLFIAALVLCWVFWEERWSVSGEPGDVARDVLSRTPVIDGHIDLPILVRSKYANNVSAFDLNERMPGHVDIPRLRDGKVGGFFWSVYVSCRDEGATFTKPSYSVRDTMEQIDVAKLMIDKYPDTFKLALTADDVRLAIKQGKIASLLGVEGGHQLSNSLGVLRQYQALGVRYVTLTHTCHNAFADSGGSIEPIEPLHGGLSKLGRALIREMNRLGVLIDLSHTSDDTAIQALKLSKAPVIWSHSSARAVHSVARNVPDWILEKIGEGEGRIGTDGVVMVNFAPYYVAPPGQSTVQTVADHVEHIAKVAGKQHVGIGSDFDGIGEVPEELEDVSKYPNLFAELVKRGWSRQDLAGLAGANLLRVLQGAEAVAYKLQREGMQPVMDQYEKRADLPKRKQDGGYEEL